jgi:hypothetical protein
MSLLPFLLLLCLGGAPAPEPTPGIAWTVLEPGLEWAEIPGSIAAEEEDGLIRVLRIDPERFDFALGAATRDQDPGARSAAAWCADRDWCAAINASLYQTDHLRSTAYLRDGDHVNNGYVSRANSFLVFGARREGIPAVTLVDRQCEDWESSARDYDTVIQSIRMVSCHRGNTWSPRERRTSVAVVGIDGTGRVLFVHVRTPVATHRLIDALLALPLDLARAMYVEGGSPAQLAVRSPELTAVFTGRPDPDRWPGPGPAAELPLPNVIGVVRRSASEPLAEPGARP